MRILFDIRGTQPNQATFHGGGEYGRVVFSRLVDLLGDNRLIATYDPTRDVSADITQLVASNDNVKAVAIKGDAELQMLIDSNEYDVLYSPLPYSYAKLDCSGIRVVVTIHGLRPIETPTDRFEIRYARSIRDRAKVAYKTLLQESYVRKKIRDYKDIATINADQLDLVVPSQHTKYALRDYLRLPIHSRVHVLYSPATVQSRSELPSDVVKHVVAKHNLECRKYFLLTSANRWVKNSFRAIHAFDSLFSRDELADYTVAVLGLSENDHAILNGVRNRARFRVIDYVASDDLVGLYAGAKALVYPTLNEGFGYPPLECMAQGTPVICAAAASLPEVTDGAAILFQPRSMDELRARILMVSDDQSIWRRYAERGKERALEMRHEQSRMLDQLCTLISAGSK